MPIDSSRRSNATKRSSNATSSINTETTLGSAAKLGQQVGRDKERKEKEDVELKPPWDLVPYSRDVAVGTSL